MPSQMHGLLFRVQFYHLEVNSLSSLSAFDALSWLYVGPYSLWFFIPSRLSVDKLFTVNLTSLVSSHCRHQTLLFADIYFRVA